MKKISYFMTMAVALVMGFTSCSSDEVVDGGGSETAVQEGLPTSVRVSLGFPTGVSMSRAGDSNTTASESKVNDAKVIIVNASGKVENVVDLTSDKMSATVETTTGNKFFYAVVNVPKDDAGTDKFPVKKNDDFNSVLSDKSFTNDYQLTSLTTENNFVMTNSDQAEAVIITEQDGETLQQVKVNVGRAVAKIDFADNIPAETPKSLGTITNIKYQVLNNNIKTYLFPRRDAAKHLITESYDRDRTLNDYVALDNGETSKEAYPFTAAGSSKYVPENSTLNTIVGNVTHVMIRGNFKPNEKYVFDADGKAAVYTVDSDFYVLKNLNSGDVLPFIFTNVLNDGAKTAVVKYYNATYKKEVSYEDLVDPSKEGYNVYKYEGGRTYYTTPLLNEKDYDKTTNAIGVYTVKRNSKYDLAVNTISKLGSNNSNWKVGEETITTDPDDTIGSNPDEPQDKPEEPTKPLDKPLSIDVSVEISDWDVITQGLDL